jgi:RNA polymerase sigma-70 factor (ECF subfamily)
MADGTRADLRADLAQGRPEAFAELYDLCAARMLAVARALTGSAADAEDAVQQTFLDLYRSRRSWAKAERPEAYAIVALRRTALRLRNRVRRIGELPREHPDSAERADADDEKCGDGLARALARLPAEQREVLALKVDGGLTFLEIGAALAISPNTVASRYRYVLERLREALGERP